MEFIRSRHQSESGIGSEEVRWKWLVEKGSEKEEQDDDDDEDVMMVMMLLNLLVASSIASERASSRSRLESR